MTTITILSYDDIITNLYKIYIESKMQKDVFLDIYSISWENFKRLLVNINSDCTPESQVKFIILCFGSTTCKNILNDEEQITKWNKSNNDIVQIFMDLLNKHPNIRDLFLCPIVEGESFFELPDSGKPLLNTDYRCGPNSDSGEVYEFDQGVIAINKNGEIIKKILDNDTPHHNLATWCIINNKSLIYPGSNNDCSEFWKLYCEAVKKGPFEIGVAGGEKGFVILQLEGDVITAFIPDEINLEQLFSLLIILAPRKKFNISFHHDINIHENSETIDYINIDYFEKYCINLFVKKNNTDMLYKISSNVGNRL